MVSQPTIMDPVANNPSPLLLLNNMSNLMSIKLDSMNYMLWKLQISAILDAYSMIEHLDGSTQQPRQFIINEDGDQTLNPAFLIWRKKDKALLTLLLSTLSSPILAMVVGSTTSQEVWNRLEEKFTCTARANVLNLKLELQGIKKGNESINSYLQRIKNTRDKLSVVGVLVDNEELLHMILKGLSKEFAPFASAIRTRDDSISFEKLSVLLQTEEQSMAVASDSFTNSALAMFVSNNHKPNNGFNGGQGYNRGRGRNSFNRGKSERPTCQICWKIGHYAIDCYHRMDFAYQGKNPPTKLAAMANASNLQYTQNSETWLTDSGASDHITANASTLNTQAPYQGTEQVTVGNGQNLPIKSILHKLCLDNNCSCHFDAHKLLIQDLPMGRLLYKGLSKDGVYPIHSSQFCRSAPSKTACLASSSAHTWQLWHSRLGHPSAKTSAFSPDSWLNTLLSFHSCTHSQISTSEPLDSNLSPTPPCLSLLSNGPSQSLLPSSVPISDSDPSTSTSNTTPDTSNPPLPTASPDTSNPPLPTAFPNTSNLPLPPATSNPNSTAPNTTSQHPMQTRSKSGIFKPKLGYAAHIDYTITEPPSYKIAAQHPQWCTAMQEEFDALQQQGTWSLVFPPPHKNVVDCKWVYKLKHNSDGTIARYKARLVAKGFHQQQGVDYAETFSPVIKPPTEEVYMAQPQGYIDSSHPHYVCKLHKSIYGLNLVGALHYLTFTRLDISFAVHQVCQYMAAPTTTHLSAAKRILRYIKGTLFHGIAFTPGPLTLSVYSDADWAGDPDDRRSTSGLLVYLGSNPITWFAKKQPTVSRSSTESEYRALATAFAEVCWLRTLLKDLGIYLSQPPILWCDNVSALAIASNPVFHARTKHIEVDFHFIRERVLRKDLVVKFVSTIDQPADVFTKSLPTQRFLDLQRNLTVSVRPHSIEGG
uniref:Reverse transcriptase Ty1/copia-type domain-containing protein n=1 Tax=Fagus sylvatica TaxID=28930 RepID=A0A2N9IMV8_FAGSY